MFSEFSFIIVITVIIYNKTTVMLTRESELLLLLSAGTASYPGALCAYNTVIYREISQ